MASSNTFEDLDLSREEIKKISDALKDEKFRKMFVEYAEEISDPENRKKYEEEIAMMENDRGMDVQFVHPQPGYVLKITTDGKQKAFINICTNDKIAKPSSEKKINEEGKRGLHWLIPHSFSPPREDADTHGKTCMVYDVVFHPDTYRMISNPRFKKLVEDTAIDGIEKQFECAIDRNNIRRPKMKYKGQAVATVIRTRKDDETGNKTAGDDGPLQNMPYPYGDKTSKELSEEKFKDAEKRVKEKKNKEEKTKFNVEKKEESGYTTPKYTITHRTNLDLQEFTNAPDSRPTTRPKELVITIELPLCRSAAGVDLDIFEDKLVLQSEKPAYKLNFKIPYHVNDEQGSAKFDKGRKCLVVSLPVVQEKAPKMPSFLDDKISEESNLQPAINGAPLIEELPDADANLMKAVEQEGVFVDKNENCQNVAQDLIQAFVPSYKITYNLPEFDFSQDSETITFVFHVRNVDEDSISKEYPEPGVCYVTFVSRGSGGFPLHYGFYVKFPEGCQYIPEHCTMDVMDRNTTLTLLKGRICRLMWNSFQVGVDQHTTQEKFFLTEQNLQRQLDQLEADGDGMGHADKQTTGEQPVLEVTVMNQKKLTIKIRKHESSISEEDEAGYADDECPSSADIQIVHSQAIPMLHGILKQRSISESSEDRSSISSESPTSTSPRDIDGQKRSVHFDSRVDRTSYKTSQSVNSMKPALKSKRRRQRKRNEKKEKSRRRQNSGGSEGSSCDEPDLRSNSGSSQSEDDPDLSGQIEETGKVVDENGVIPEEDLPCNEDQKGNIELENQSNAIHDEKQESVENEEVIQSELDGNLKEGSKVIEKQLNQNEGDKVKMTENKKSEGEKVKITENKKSEGEKVKMTENEKSEGEKVKMTENEKSEGEKVKMTKLVENVKEKMAKKSSDSDENDSDDDGYRTSNVNLPDSGDHTEKYVDRTSDKSACESAKDSDLSSFDGSMAPSTGAGDGDTNANIDTSQAADVERSGASSSGMKGAIKVKSKGVGMNEKNVRFDSESVIKSESEIIVNASGEVKGNAEDGDAVVSEENVVETDLSWKDGGRRDDPNNPHRSECAFQFSNSVMYDLDID